MGELFGGLFGLIIILLGIVLLILWFLLPFAVFGVKDKLNQIISEAGKANRELNLLRSEFNLLRKEYSTFAADRKDKN